MMLRRALLALGALMPFAGPASVAAQPARPRFYAKGTKQRAVRFAGSEGATLAGTLLLPIWSELEKVPGVVLVSGSGPTDRDGNSPAGIRASTYRLLAQGLAARGIHSVRIDKRGMFGSRAAAADANAVTIAD